MPFALRSLIALLLVATCTGLFVAFTSPRDWTLHVGHPSATRFLAGFFKAETHNGTTFRWSGPDSQLVLHGAGAAPLLLGLRLHGDARAATEASSIRLQRDAQTLAAFALDTAPEWRIYHVLLPPGAAVRPNGEAAPLLLLRDTYRPGAEDGRDLGVPVDWVRVRAVDVGLWELGTLAWVSLYRALLLTWLLALVTWLLWRLWCAARRTNQVFCTLLVVLLAALAATLIWYALYDPALLAWAVPPAPWIAGLCTLLLLTTGTGRWTPGVTWASGATTYPARRIRYALLLIFVVALAMRLYRIDELPYSLWRDEARHGMVALRILEDPGYHPVYEPRWGIHLPGMGFYPFALALHTWGIHAWSMRLVTALAGALTVLPLYALVCGLTRRYDVALLAAALLAVSSWHVSISRFSFPTIFGPLLTLTALWLLIKAHTALFSAIPVQSRLSSLRAAGVFLLAGAVLGMAVQTYHTGRIVPLLAVLLMVAMQYGSRQSGQPYPAQPPDTAGRLGMAVRLLPGIAGMGVGFLLVTGPLLSYVLDHPQAFNRRVGSLLILSDEARQGRAPLAAFDEALGKHLLMFHVRGDSNGRHHAPGHPLLDVVTGIGLLAGCGLLLRHWRDWRAWFLLIALGVSLLPSLLAVEGPHAMRSIEAVALACTIAAWGWVAIVQWGVRVLARKQEDEMHQRWSRTVSVAIVLAALLLNARTYFVTMAVDPAVWASSYPVHTQIGIYLRDVADTQGDAAVAGLYVPEHLRKNPVLSYLVHGLPVQTFDSATVTETPPGALLVLSGYTYQHDVRDLTAVLGSDPQPVHAGPLLPGTDEPSFVVYRVVQE